MIKNGDSLKAKASNLSNKTNIPNKYIIQNFMFEALLRRISLSKYKDKFIIKGGLLLSSIFGVNLRSTMDLDTTIKGMALDKVTITKVISEIINIKVDDNVKLEIENIKDIREEDLYSGFNVNLKSEFDGIKTNLMMDITTGDVITYKEVKYKYNALFDDETIDVMTYNYETIIAEKFESIISRNVNNTRMKDYYDLYMFVNIKWKYINKKTLKSALLNTSKNRDTLEYIDSASSYIDLISNDSRIKNLWDKYRKTYEYASNIEFIDVINSIIAISKILISEESTKK